MLNKIIYIFTLLSISLISYAQNSEHVKLGATTLKVDNKNYLVLNFSNDKKWHTYWKNPGDAGLPMKMTFTVDSKEVELSSLPWPAPQRYIEQGDMWAYGYEGKYSLFFDLPQNLANKTMNILGEWLVCKDICIPGKQSLDLKLDATLTGRAGNFFAKEVNLKHLKNLPYKAQANGIEFFLSKGRSDKELALSYTIENVDKSLIPSISNLITPYPLSPLTYKHEELYLDEQNKTLYGRIYIDWDGEYEEPVWELPNDGIFKKELNAQFLLHYPNNKPAKIITHNYKQFTLTGDKALSETFKTFSNPLSKTTTSAPTQNSLIYYILFAFLGGLILNLMPCVLPVISLKLFGLIVHSDESRSQILKHNIAYTLGVVFSFMVLASTVFALKTSGDQIGWGFQLQSPLFVFIMLIVIFVMALNMLGLFEFVTPGGKTLGNSQIKKGFSADFVNGILATILSTPCSAPFLGTALTFAFTTSSINIFIIFFSVAIGLSFPFILTGLFPTLIKFLPKPGLWMDKLKKILGLSLLLTVVWLYDVLAAIIDMSFAGIYINTIIVMIFFAFYFRKSISKNLIWNIIIFSLPILLTVQSLRMDLFDVSENQTQTRSKNSLQWNKWSKEKLNQSNKITFVNFTASWCLTCKVNKKIVLDSDDFSKIVKDKDITLLEGDWTKRDEEITSFLRSYNIVGVPAYFIKTADGKIHSLGETISIDKIESYLK